MCFPGGSVVKNPPANAGDLGSIPGWGRSLEKEMTPHSSILAWEIPCTEEPGGLQSVGLQRVRHDLVTKQQQQPSTPCGCALIPGCVICKPLGHRWAMWTGSGLCGPEVGHVDQKGFSVPACQNPLPGPSTHGLSQARILEWGVISSFRGSSQSRD